MKKILLLLTFISVFIVNAQDDPTVFTVNGKAIKNSEFERVYKKNIDLVQDKDQKKIDNYLDLYIKYQLKLQEAYAEGLDKDPQYQRELAQYRKDLMKNYLTDATVTNKLIQEAYDRSLKEINASHILVRLAPDALPKDTLAAYNKIDTIRKKALAGANFEDLAKQYSEDPSAKNNGGNLGYFTVFQMVYPFETAVYTTPKGKISSIFRTRFGYHIAKVNDVRPAHGEVEVAHIMIATNKKNEKEAKEKIDKIYTQLKNGVDFATLAKRLSDDKSSAVKGGRLARFGINKMVPSFEKEAFALQHENEFSKPFKSPYGWHIVKLIHKFPVPSYDEAKSALKYRITNDVRSKLITDSFLKKIEQQYTITRNANIIKDFEPFIDAKYFLGKWMPSEVLKNDKRTALTINDNVKTYADFANYLQRNQINARGRKQAVKSMLAKQYVSFVNDAVMNYYKAHLEETNPDFAHTMQEYRDGVLLFNLMNKAVWDKATKDTLGLKAYYENHKNKYVWKKRATIVLATVTNKAKAKQVRKLLKAGKSEKEIAEVVNKDKIYVLFSQKKIEEGAKNLPKAYKLKKGVSKVIKDNANYIVIKTAEIKPSEPKDFESCKGQVTNEYQNQLEKDWLTSLKNKYKVIVNQPVIDALKKKYE